MVFSVESLITLPPFTGSLKPILPSLQTFGIAFATTGLGAMFMTNALISAIKFIFNNPLMFIGSLIGGFYFV